MASPELQPHSPPPEVQHVPEQMNIPIEMGQSGATPTQVQAQPLQDAQTGQVLVQPMVQVPQPQVDIPTIKIPAYSEEQLEQLAHGDPAEQATWFGEFWLRKVKQAISSGVQAVFGTNG